MTTCLAVAGCEDGGGDDGVSYADAAPGGADAAPMPTADAAPMPTADAGPASTTPCPAGPAGTACLFAQWDALGAGSGAGCGDAAVAAAFAGSIAARHGDLPAYQDGRALFVTLGGAAHVAGAFNDWNGDGPLTQAVCGSATLFAAEIAVAEGRWPYKLVAGGTWSLDPENWAFVYDDFAGNADGMNSVLNTPGSGLGHLELPDDEVCSMVLGNCRSFVTYLPAGYDSPTNATTTYPTVFMHDGQNVFDDHDCCFGHTGWEVNVTLDAEIAAGHIAPAIVVGFPHAGAGRSDEYGWSLAGGGLRETFMAFQVETVQPAAAAKWRVDPQRVFVAGSSLGGLVSMHLALAYPEVYAGAASLSGAFWPEAEEGRAFADVLAATAGVDVPVYLDHGGSAMAGGDGYADSIAVRDLMIDKGWTMGTSPGCAMGARSLCYFHEPGATHDELAWKDRAWRFLAYFLPPG